MHGSQLLRHGRPCPVSICLRPTANLQHRHTTGAAPELSIFAMCLNLQVTTVQFPPGHNLTLTKAKTHEPTPLHVTWQLAVVVPQHGLVSRALVNLHESHRTACLQQHLGKHSCHCRVTFDRQPCHKQLCHNVAQQSMLLLLAANHCSKQPSLLLAAASPNRVAEL